MGRVKTKKSYGVVDAEGLADYENRLDRIVKPEEERQDISKRAGKKTGGSQKGKGPGVILKSRLGQTVGEERGEDGGLVIKGVKGLQRRDVVADIAVGYAQERGEVVKAGRKRTLAQREQDLVVISDLYLKGASQYAIAEEINRLRQGEYKVSPTTIGKDIAEVLFRWQRHYLGATEERVGTELARLAKVEAELWDAWFVSKEGDYERNIGEVSGQNNAGKETEDAPEAGASGAMSKAKSFVRVRKSEKIVKKGANPEYMRQIIEVVKLRAQLLGIITQRAQVTVDWRREAAASGVDPDKVIDVITKAIIEGGQVPQAMHAPRMMIEANVRDAE